MIEFRKLTQNDFALLLSWLEEPHVKLWCDQDINWTEKLISDKYLSYIDGYKLENCEKKSLKAFIILYDNQPIEYIQGVRYLQAFLGNDREVSYIITDFCNLS